MSPGCGPTSTESLAIYCDGNRNRDDLLARAVVEPSPDWLACNGSRWALRIDAGGIRHASDLPASA